MQTVPLFSVIVVGGNVDTLVASTVKDTSVLDDVLERGIYPIFLA